MPIEGKCEKSRIVLPTPNALIENNILATVPMRMRSLWDVARKRYLRMVNHKFLIVAHKIVTCSHVNYCCFAWVSS